MTHRDERIARLAATADPDAIADDLVRAWYAGPYNLHHEFDQEVADVALALRAYGEAQRERCAEVARGHQRWNTAEGGEAWNVAGAIVADIYLLD